MVNAKSVKARRVGDAVTDGEAPARGWTDGVLPPGKVPLGQSTDDKWRRGSSKFSVNTFFSDRTASAVGERISITRWLRVIVGGKDESDEKYDAKPVSFLQLFRFASIREKRMVAIGVAFALLVGAIQPFSMYLNGRIADIFINYGTYTANGKESQFLKDGFTYVFISGGIGFGLIAFSFAQYFFLRAAAIDVTNTLRVKFIQAILRQDAAFFGTRKFGAINAQLNSNIERVGDGIGDKIGLLLRGVASFITAMAAAFVVNWRIALSMCAVGPVCLIIMSSLSKAVGYAARRSQRATEEAGAVLQETLVNVRTVQASNGEITMVKKFARLLTAGRRDAVLQYVANGTFDGLFFFSLYIFNAIGAYYGAGRTLYGGATGGDVIIVTNLIILGAYYLGAMSPYIANVFQARVAAAVIYAQIDMIPERIDSYSTEGKSLASHSGCDIEFDNVSFAYPLGKSKRREVLRGISWQARQGENIALVGHSGCGKSTCISLMTRLYECDSGAVRVNGIDVKELKIQSLRRAIGIVSQEPVLFGRTIFENIALGDSTITVDQVEAACRIANAHDFIEKLEHGYNTKIGAGNVKLSGGQKQRIAIARALINDPPILILDEATSALDAESEILVQQALESASHGRTTVIIAHRLSTLRNADKIVVIDQGRVVESGTHKSLNDNVEGVYARFVQSQSFASLSKSVVPIGMEKVVEDHEDTKSESRSSHPEKKISEESNLADDRWLIKPKIEKKVSTISKDTESTATPEKETNKSLWDTSIVRIYRTADRNYGKLATAIVFSALRGTELVLYVQLISAIFKSYADYEMDHDVDSFYSKQYVIVAGNIALGIFCLLTISIGQSFCGWTTENVVDLLKIRAFRNILRQDGAFFDRARCSGAELIKRITVDAYALKAPLDFRLFNLVNNSSAIVALMAASLMFSWRISLIGLLLLLIMSIAPTCISLRMQRHVAKKQREDEISKMAVEVIENVRTIQLLSKENYFCQKYRDNLLLVRRPAIVTAIFDGVIFALVQSFIFISDAFCFGAGILAIYYHLNTPNDVYIASMNMGTASYAVLFVSTSLRDILRAKTPADSIFELIDAKPITSEGTLTIVDKGNVDVESVDFAYPTRPHHLVADNLSLNVKRGECVALVGPSGGGKSTIISLLQRFYDPKSGSIQIDGVNIAQYSLRSLREQIALVEQEPVLFSGSIYDNVRLGVESTTTLEDVVKACEMANAKSFIESLPLGYQTEVGEKSSRLSGGQKQRIAIARALIRQPKILLLDEATSALDAQSEEAVRQALHAAQCQSACITIAHRLSSIQNADRVYFIRNGHVVESGTYRQLLADPRSQFAQMVAKQLLQ